jgi:hypothetical protein
MLGPTFSRESSEHGVIVDLLHLRRHCRRAGTGVPFLLSLALLDNASLHRAGVGAEPEGERKVTGAIKSAPVVDPMKGREVALDVELVVEYPVNLRPPLL